MNHTNYNFLSKGGEMGALTRAKDWSKTPVGPVETWPQSLRTTLGILLNSKFPMFLFWGPEHICFYNDAYRPSLGNNGKHPEILGQKGAEYWPEIWEFIGPLIDQVLTEGEATWHEDQLVPIYRNGKIEDVYWTFSYSPVINDDGKITGVLVVCTETTEKVKINRQLGESEKKFKSIIEQIPLGIAILNGPDLVFEMANKTYYQIVDKTEEELLNTAVFSTFPQVKETVNPLFKKVFEEGTPYSTDELQVTLNRFGRQEECFFNIVFYPLREESSAITGIIVVCYEVTQSVKARHVLAEREKAFRNLVIQSPIAMTIFKGKDHIIELANTAMLNEIWQKQESDVIGKPALEVFPELLDQKYPKLLQEVLIEGKTIQENEALAFIDIKGKLEKFYLDYQYTPLFDKTGEISAIMITVNNVTDKVDARKKVEEAEERVRLASEIAEIVTWDLNIPTQELIYSDNLPALFGLSKEQKISRPQILSQIYSEDLPVIEKAYKKALKTHFYKYEARIIKPDSSISWIRVHGKMFFDEFKNPVKMLGTIMDVTIEKNNQEILMKSEEKFRLLADSMQQFVWTSDAMGNLNYFNQSLYDFTGLTKINVRDNGWLQVIHPDDREENINRWMESIKSGNEFLFEHRFLRHDGKYRWQASHAIPQKDSKGIIQMWVGTSSDIQEQKDSTNLLETQVLERTEELESKNKDLINMNIELQSFAYISSHDLQEPLRKIQTFASRLTDLDEQNISPRAKTYLERIEVSAKRMQALIQDLLSYSRTNSADRTFVKANLDEIAEEVIMDFSDRIEEKNAVIDLHPLGEGTVMPFQFRQLLHNLIGNALKFSRKEIPPRIEIKARRVIGHKLNFKVDYPDKIYFCLRIADNGIGFDDEYKDRIFEVFQRLNTESEYLGTGIGLAIVKKIVENHKGVIKAHSEKGKGATFKIFLPEL
ncbi:PAS domain-containing sensor histidine kinase [Flavobacterium branchiicola]|uniref:histidine kinase n=1 Tax=Flavobacterium branchiicola TaxID=1114875 RepID=A0ABV9PDR5_9FLAO|nr:PAS domain S-box protein [Flavobacterium branchiicola]MBS7253538.1 PAS domain-containing protein [Flavobacterium branchiicola]